ncbi:hypothetical protein [Bacillus nitratireducens]|uniref:hypothetical protein n=1 Tax=Bacillus nitratireducens TaxID=2026193 RepID=UPI0008972038|nr:hypothetical protein [Bacillus nitratireducens]SEA91279.1 hypothetical protein SAMN04488146_104407 [Bacillus nitratireducens]
MDGIIKRRKTVDYAQIHNNALQQLEDVRSIGLIAHLMSLPETWVIKKMQLYKKFGRAAITKGIAELEEKKYWVDIKYRDGKKNFHYYNASDIPFSDDEVKEFMEEVVTAGFKIMEISSPFSHLFSSGGNQQLKKEEDSSSDDFEQFNFNNSISNVEKRHLLNKKTEKNTDKQNNDKRNIVNINKELSSADFKIALTNACNEFYTEFAPNRWIKKSWNTLIDKFVTETIESGRYVNIPQEKISAYAYSSLKNMAHKYDLKNGKKEFADPTGERKILLYNWLEDEGDTVH